MSGGNRSSIYGPEGRARHVVRDVAYRDPEGKLVYLDATVKDTQRIDVEPRAGATGPLEPGVVLARQIRSHHHRGAYSILYRGSRVNGVPRPYTYYSPSLPRLGGRGMAEPTSDYKDAAKRGATDDGIVAAYLLGFEEATSRALQPSWRDYSASEIQALVDQIAQANVVFALLAVTYTDKAGTTTSLRQTAGFSTQEVQALTAAIVQAESDATTEYLALIKTGSATKKLVSLAEQSILRSLPSKKGTSALPTLSKLVADETAEVAANFSLDLAEQSLTQISFDAATQPREESVRLQETVGLTTLRDSAIVQSATSLNRVAGAVVAKLTKASGIKIDAAFDLDADDLLDNPSAQSGIALSELSARVGQLIRDSDDPAATAKELFPFKK